MYCDNPWCRFQIISGSVEYNKRDGEVYHSVECARLANAHRTMNEGKVALANDQTPRMIVMNTEAISLKKH